MCIDKGVDLETGVLHDTDTAASWSRTLTPVIAGLPTGASVLVDITTMPRDIIWQCFWLLELRRCTLSYVYHRPQQYGQWLSRDPGRPRLTYKMSGIARMGARTALVILAGYDIDRVKHLTDVFEPAVTLLGLQVDSVDPHNSSKMSAVKSAFAGDSSVELFRVDAFSPDCGRSAIESSLQGVRASHNVLMASMGPKLSAVSLYAIHRSDDSLGLVYMPSNEFNRDYSSGIGESIWGEMSAR